MTGITITDIVTEPINRLNVIEDGYELNSDIMRGIDLYIGGIETFGSQSMNIGLTLEGQIMMGLIALINDTRDKSISKEFSFIHSFFHERIWKSVRAYCQSYGIILWIYKRWR